MNAKELLIGAKKKIENPENWTTCAYARDRNDSVVFRLDSAACKFCATGALYVTADLTGSNDRDALKLLNQAAFELGHEGGVVSLNDSEGSHARVMRMFDLAIEKAG